MKKNLVLAALILSVSLTLAGCGQSTTATTATTATPAATDTTAPAVTPAPAAPAGRVVKGVATDLATGTFTGGKEIPVGIYDAVSTGGDSGNFTITGSDGTLMTNEILGVQDGQGVSTVRVIVSQGDVIKIEGITSVHFTPVTNPYQTVVTTQSLYAGYFEVDQDIAAGRYTVTPAAGASGNFQTFGNDGSVKENEILGGSNGVPSVTVDLASGDLIKISSINSVTFTPAQ